MKAQTEEQTANNEQIKERNRKVRDVKEIINQKQKATRHEGWNLDTRLP